MNTNPYVLLWLEGPLQAWGVNAKFSRRTSLDFPSRSGVLGLLCAALGAGGPQEELLQLFLPLQQTVICYTRRDKNGKTTQLPLQLRDFHMVGSGYDSKDPWQTLHIPKTSDQRKAVKGGTKLTYRYYVQDAAFAVVLAVPAPYAQKIADALAMPHWDLALGRKCCVPTEFIGQGVYASQEEALQRADLLAEQKNRAEIFRVLDGKHEGEQMLFPDVPQCFGPEKLYSERTITIVRQL